MSTAAFTTLQSSGGTVPTETLRRGSAKAWVQFNGTGTVAVADSFNTSSITDNGTGNYTENFTNAMSGAGYGVSVSARRTATNSAVFGTLQQGATTQTGSVNVASVSTGGGNEDATTVCAGVVI